MLYIKNGVENLGLFYKFYKNKLIFSILFIFFTYLCLLFKNF